MTELQTNVVDSNKKNNKFNDNYDRHSNGVSILKKEKGD